MLTYKEKDISFSDKYSNSLIINCDLVTEIAIQDWIENTCPENIWYLPFSNTVYFTESKYLNWFRLSWPEENLRHKTEFDAGYYYCPYIPVVKSPHSPTG